MLFLLWSLKTKSFLHPTFPSGCCILFLLPGAAHLSPSSHPPFPVECTKVLHQRNHFWGGSRWSLDGCSQCSVLSSYLIRSAGGIWHSGLTPSALEPWLLPWGFTCALFLLAFAQMSATLPKISSSSYHRLQFPFLSEAISTTWHIMCLSFFFSLFSVQ